MTTLSNLLYGLKKEPSHSIDFHPLSEIIPAVLPYYVKEMSRDIQENGLLEPITMYQDLVLDGRTRLAACDLAGAEPRFETFDGGDRQALEFILSKNMKRRHLRESQRAMIAAKIANLAHGGDRRSDQSSNLSLGQISQRDAADMLSVSRTLVQGAKKILDADYPVLSDLVSHGSLPVSLVAKAVAIPREKLVPALDAIGWYKMGPTLSSLIDREAKSKVVMRVHMPIALYRRFDEERGLLQPEQHIEELMRLQREYAGCKLACLTKPRADEVGLISLNKMYFHPKCPVFISPCVL